VDHADHLRRVGQLRLYCGAQVDFVDIDPRTYNLCPQALGEAGGRPSRRPLPKVVVPVHLCGQPCDMAAIHALGQRYGFRIIEDASHAIGGKYQGRIHRQLPLQRHHRVQLPPGQDHHHRRRRHGGHQRRAAGRKNGRCCAATASPAIPGK
jgi:hypothetical protein